MLLIGWLLGYREGDSTRGIVNRSVTGMSAECVICRMTSSVSFDGYDVEYA